MPVRAASIASVSSENSTPSQLGAALGQPGTQQGPVGQAFRAGQDDGGVGGLGQAAQAEGVDDHRATLRGGQPPTYPLPEA